jgi:aspartyl-tRNA(Asn)/glutamyl-tRNA(Gln) amidotransferase subunit C
MKMRKDEVTDGHYPNKIVANAPVQEDAFFMVPKVVE